ncbi:hypothetical protein TNCV_1448681 [Trichonephila clavipes]|nr:hypothetical protein TNCV_1448681 [Trichonephila clavipes]
MMTIPDMAPNSSNFRYTATRELWTSTDFTCIKVNTLGAEFYQDLNPCLDGGDVSSEFTTRASGLPRPFEIMGSRGQEMGEELVKKKSVALFQQSGRHPDSSLPFCGYGWKVNAIPIGCGGDVPAGGLFSLLSFSLE